jgi:hypothetical protein
MSVKINSTLSKIIPAKEMKDGQIGVVVGSDNIVVQAYYGSLVRIGESGGKGWSRRNNLTPSFVVRLLEPGETIIVVNN